MRSRNAIRNLSDKSFRASKSRNVIAIIAIALTSVLFTTLFTMGIGTVESFRKATMRQAGGDGHAVLKYISDDEFDHIKNNPLIKEIGYDRSDRLPHYLQHISDFRDPGYPFLRPAENHRLDRCRHRDAQDDTPLPVRHTSPPFNKGLGLSQQANSHGPAGRRGRLFLGSVATLPMLAAVSSHYLLQRENRKCQTIRIKKKSRRETLHSQRLFSIIQFPQSIIFPLRRLPVCPLQ